MKVCFVCDRKLGFVHEPFNNYTLNEEQRKSPKGFKDDSLLCRECVDSLPKINEEVIQRKEPKPEPKPTAQGLSNTKALPSSESDMIWILPILAGVIGGVIMYFILKDGDKDRALKGLYVGVAINVISAIIGVIVLVLVAI